MRGLLGDATLALLIGILFLVLSVFLGMSIGSLLVGALVFAAVAFASAVMLARFHVIKPSWVYPGFSAVPLLVVGVSGPTPGSSEGFYVLAATAVIAGLAGAYAGASRASNNGSREP